MIGATGAGILLVAMIAGPMLSGRGSAAGSAAAEQAELARRQATLYDPGMQAVQRRAALDRVKEADFDALASRVTEQLQAKAEEFSRAVNAAKSADSKSGLKSKDLRPLGSDGGSMRTAVTAFEKLLVENQKLLAEAAKAATAASSTDKNAPGLGLTRGLLKMVEAQDALHQARDIRRAFGEQQSELLLVAADWNVAKSDEAGSAGVDVAPVLTKLDEDLKQTDMLIKEANDEVGSLEKNIATHEQSLAQVKDELQKLRAEYNRIQDAGFKAGDDAAFDAYRKALAGASDKLRDAQRTEQWLIGGGANGATVAGDDMMSGELQGGEAFAGIENLKVQRDALKGRVAQLTTNRQRIETAIKNTRDMGSAAKSDAEARATRVGAVFANLDKVRQRAEELSKQAAELEDKAISAAREAASHFQSAGAAAEQLRGPARKLQSEFDPQRKNARINMILADDRMELQAGTLEAEAKALIGSTQAARVASLRSYKETLGTVVSIVKGASFDEKSLDQAIGVSLEEALGTLSDARAALDRFATSGKPTSWLQQGTLGCVEFAMAQIDTAKATEHMAAASANLQKAVEKREQSPYLSPSVLTLKTQIAGASPAAPTDSQPADGAASPKGDKPAGG